MVGSRAGAEIVSQPGRMHRDPAHKDLFKSARVAWPTMGVFLAACTLWVTSLALGVTHHLPTVASVCVSALAGYLAYSPLHEAIHGSLTQVRWLRWLVGVVSSLMLTGNFPAARYTHLEHHRHTNDPRLDPDYWSGAGPTLLRPLRWMSQDLHYYGVYFRAWRARPRSERIEVAVALLCTLGLAGGCVAKGYGAQLVLFWLLPARLAITLLAYLFDYVPHWPHQVLAKEDRFRVTSVAEGRCMDLLSLGQTYHLIHHLYPGVPFYRYRKIFEVQSRELLARGVVVSQWF